MAENDSTGELTPLTEDVRPHIFSPPPHPLAPLLTHLAFEAPLARIGLETTICVFLFLLFEHLPWQLLGIPGEWAPLAAWSCGCFIVGVLDTILLRRPFFICREAYQLALCGAYERAISTLDQISPYGTCSTPCPRGLYHLLRADIYTQAETPLAAQRELTSALSAGVEKAQVLLMKSRIERVSGNYEEARREIEEARAAAGETPVVLLEEGLTLLEERADMRAAKKVFDRVRMMHSEAHPSGETTRDLAEAYFAACQLWTGEAEEGLHTLSAAIERLRSLVRYVDTLRPVLARLCAERSYYFATHREPQGAVLDIRVASALCASPLLRGRYNAIREELEWRHKILIPPLS